MTNYIESMMNERREATVRAAKRIKQDLKVIAGPLKEKYGANVLVTSKLYLPEQGALGYIDMRVYSRHLFRPELIFDTGATHHPERRAVYYTRPLAFPVLQSGCRELASKNDIAKGLITLAFEKEVENLSKKASKIFKETNPQETMRDFLFSIEDYSREAHKSVYSVAQVRVGGGYTPEITEEVGKLLLQIDNFIDNTLGFVNQNNLTNKSGVATKRLIKSQKFLPLSS